MPMAEDAVEPAACSRASAAAVAESAPPRTATWLDVPAEAHAIMVVIVIAAMAARAHRSSGAQPARTNAPERLEPGFTEWGTSECIKAATASPSAGGNLPFHDGSVKISERAQLRQAGD